MNSELSWRGIHHLALATPDLDATRHFYNDMLGMPISDVYPSREGRGRHCFVYVKPGDSETWGLHFFERANVRQDGALLHIAFSLPDKVSAHVIRDRLREHDVDVTEIEELGGNLLFKDNSGIMLEVTWPKG